MIGPGNNNFDICTADVCRYILGDQNNDNDKRDRVLTYFFQRVFNTHNSFNLTSISSSQITYLDDSADD